jgi:hypothetical protein
MSLNYSCHHSQKRGDSKSIEPLIILVIMTIIIWVFNGSTKVCAGIKEIKEHIQRKGLNFI